MCQFPGKVNNPTFLTQFYPKMDLGLEFRETNVEIKIRQNGKV